MSATDDVIDAVDDAVEAEDGVAYRSAPKVPEDFVVWTGGQERLRITEDGRFYLDRDRLVLGIPSRALFLLFFAWAGGILTGLLFR